jgi:4-hydroxymandelate synthase
MRDLARETGTPGDFSLDYVELYVEKLETAAFDWVDRYAFTVVASGGSAEHRSLALRHGRITLVLTEAISDRHPAAAYLRTHGGGVANLALRTANVEAAFRAAVAHGASIHRRPTRYAGHGAGVTAAVRGFGDVVHTFVQRRPGDGLGLPVGFAPALSADEGRPDETGLLDIDHVAICLNAGDLAPTVEFYRDAFGLREVAEEPVALGAQTAGSTVLRNRAGTLALALCQPEAEAGSPGGPVAAFLRDHRGAGVQHIALSTSDSQRTVRALTRRGVAFHPAPAGLAPVQRPPGTDGTAPALCQPGAACVHLRDTLHLEVVERRAAGVAGLAATAPASPVRSGEREPVRTGGRDQMA